MPVLTGPYVFLVLTCSTSLDHAYPEPLRKAALENQSDVGSNGLYSDLPTHSMFPARTNTGAALPASFKHPAKLVRLPNRQNQ
jgi:hypothetical protein